MAAPNHQAPVHGKTDLDHWMEKASYAAKDPSPITHPTGTGAWHNGFFDCFTPVDTCFITCCCPCVTFGKTHYRLNKDPTLAGYSPVNTSCLAWYLTACCGLHCIGQLIQRSDIRARAQPHLSGNFATDFLKAWCCSCCDLIQQDKEAEHLLKTPAVVAQPGMSAGMSYAPQ